MADELIFDHAYPVQLDFQCESDLTGGSVKIEGVKPDGTTTFQWSATVDDAAAGLCHVTTTEDLIDQDGLWHMQAVHYPAGSNDGVPGSIVRMRVKPRLKATT